MRGFFTLLGLSIVGVGFGQTIPMTYPTIEAMVTPARNVFTGVIVKVDQKVDVGPDGKKVGEASRRFPEGYSTYTFTIRTEETLKGRIGKEVKLSLSGSDGRTQYKEWQAAQTRFLFLVGGDYDSWSLVAPYTFPGEPIRDKVSWSMIRLGEPVLSEQRYDGYLRVPMLASDLSIIRTSESLLDRARIFLKTLTKNTYLTKVEVPFELPRDDGFLNGGGGVFAIVPMNKPKKQQK